LIFGLCYTLTVDLPIARRLSNKKIMKVTFYSTIRLLIDQKTIEIDYVENLTVLQLLNLVVDRYPVLHQTMFNENGELYPHAHVYINGRDVPYLEKTANTMLNPTDKVDIFPPGHF
jgi:molybdopterin synthase sulfur carrier subunit